VFVLNFSSHVSGCFSCFTIPFSLSDVCQPNCWLHLSSALHKWTLDYTLLKVTPLILLALLISIAYFVYCHPSAQVGATQVDVRICYIQVKKPVTIIRKMTKCATGQRLAKANVFVHFVHTTCFYCFFVLVCPFCVVPSSWFWKSLSGSLSLTSRKSFYLFLVFLNMHLEVSWFSWELY